MLALVDSDPYGLKILSVYMKGYSLPPKILSANNYYHMHWKSVTLARFVNGVCLGGQYSGSPEAALDVQAA